MTEDAPNDSSPVATGTFGLVDEGGALKIGLSTVTSRS